MVGSFEGIAPVARGTSTAVMGRQPRTAYHVIALKHARGRVGADGVMPEGHVLLVV